MKSHVFLASALLLGCCGCWSSKNNPKEVPPKILSSEETFALIKKHMPEEFHPISLKKIAIKDGEESVHLFSDGKYFFVQDYEQCFPLNPQLGALKIKHSFCRKLDSAGTLSGYFVVAENELYRCVVLIFAKFAEQWHSFYVMADHGDLAIDFLTDREMFYLTVSDGEHTEKGFLVIEPNNVSNPLAVNWLSQKVFKITQVHMPLYDVRNMQIYRGLFDQKKKETALKNLVPHLLVGKSYCEIEQLNRMGSQRVFLLYPQSLRSLNYDLAQAYTFVGWSHPSLFSTEKKYDIENYFYRVEREKKEPLKSFFPGGVDLFYLFDFH